MDIQAPDPVFNEPAPAAPEPADAEPTLADHEAEFSRGSRAPAPTADGQGPPVAPTGEDPAAAAEARDDKGRFKPGKGRHRAASQQASPADVPRIAELTRKLRETEAERDTLRTQRQAAPAPRVEPQRQAEPVAKPTLKQYVDALKDDEPYEAAIERHAEALADWKLEDHQRRSAMAAEAREHHQTFTSRIAAAKAKYPDFDAVALRPDFTAVPPGSLVDHYIRNHQAGGDLLYHFAKDGAELTRVLSLPDFEQAEALALLGQRFSASSQAQAAQTGSAAPRPAVTPAPRPPNPVRTGPMHTGDDPTTEDELSLADHEKHWVKRRR